MAYGPRPAPKFVAPPHKHLDPSALATPVEEREFDGPTLEQWVANGYDAARYPGEDAFMRKKIFVKADHIAQEPVEQEHDASGDEEHHES